MDKEFKKLNSIIVNVSKCGKSRASLGINLAYEKQVQCSKSLFDYYTKGVWDFNGTYKERSYHDMYILFSLFVIQISLGFRIFGKPIKKYDADWVTK